MKNKWVQSVAGLLILLVCLYVFLHKAQTGNSRMVESQNSHRLPDELSSRPGLRIPDDFVASTPKSAHLDSGKPKFLSREALLEQICPSLTEAEENEYLEKNGRSAASLVGLTEVGSPRGNAYLSEALSKFPDDPLVQYAALAWAHAALDPAKCAQVLGAAFPRDSLPRQIEVWAMLEKGDEAAALENLKNNAAEQTTTIFNKQIQELKDEVWKGAGRSAEQFTTRAALEGNALPQLNLLTGIFDLFGKRQNVSDMSAEAKAALPYIAYCFQDLVESREIGMLDNIIARVGEREALQMMAAIDGGTQSTEMFPVPLEEMISQAEAEEMKLGGLAEFASDITLIYQRIKPGQQEEFIRLTNEFGQQRAMAWLLETNHEVFIDPEFPPNGIPKDVWEKARFKWLERTRPN